MRVRSKDIIGQLLDRVSRLEAANNQSLPELLTVGDLAAFLRTSPKAIRAMHARRQLPDPVALPNRRLLWQKEVVSEWFARRTVNAS